MLIISLWSSIGWAKYWSYLGCKFESYREHKVMMELVDMNSLGLFDYTSYPFKSDSL